MKELEKLRRELHIVAQAANLTDPKLLLIAAEVDKLVVEEMKRRAAGS